MSVTTEEVTMVRPCSRHARAVRKVSSVALLLLGGQGSTLLAQQVEAGPAGPSPYDVVRSRQQPFAELGHAIAVAALPIPIPTMRAQTSCEALSSLSLPNTTITLARSVSAGENFTFHGRDQTDGDLPAFCWVAATVKPTMDSDIRMEVWLPTSSWNSRFLAVSSNDDGGMVGALEAGYATSWTDTGQWESPSRKLEDDPSSPRWPAGVRGGATASPSEVRRAGASIARSHRTSWNLHEPLAGASGYGRTDALGWLREGNRNRSPERIS